MASVGAARVVRTVRWTGIALAQLQTSAAAPPDSNHPQPRAYQEHRGDLARGG